MNAAMGAVARTTSGEPRLEASEESKFLLGSGAASVYSDFGGFRAWLKEADKTKNTSTAIAILSHHDGGSLYFSKDGARLTAETLARQSFARPSMAILCSCSTLAVGADAIVRNLNAGGVETIIATNSQVSGSLAGDFLACLVEELEKAAPSPITASDLFYRAQRCTWKRPKDAADPGSPSKYGAQVLSFSLAGNPSLSLCTPGST
ncbi:MAG: hypothetical protein HC897_06085 [Thermoanaerobaculia bacterium]|nr:hypothetical protein [Thermoanaerobaculia bacterium]